jgi:calcineurin-like phosphoesterase family protein
MSCVYVTSDWHIGHNGISHKFRTQYPDDSAHDNHILKTAKDMVKKRDVLFVLGDVTWTQSGLELIDSYKFPCKMIMLKGNHDTLPTSDYLAVFDEVEGTYKYKRYWFTHIPIHPQELYRGHNVHGHCHMGGPYVDNIQEVHDNRYYNAILEFNDYKPVNMQVIGTILNKK